jgi:hypothetical protein
MKKNTLVATNKQTNKQTRDWLDTWQLQKEEEEEEEEGKKKEGSFLAFFIKNFSVHKQH